MSLKLKVCGMREVENLTALGGVSPDFIGLIFYSKSPRDASNTKLNKELISDIPRVGVFVNPTLEEVLEKAKVFNLSYVQLHGDESVQMAKDIKLSGLGIIKVFRVADVLPIEQMTAFADSIDYFLFDTKTNLFGGSGRKFDWNVLEEYPFAIPYFLSGGIAPEDVELICKMNLPGLYAIDINSRFEIAPGHKDIEKIRKVKELL